MNGEDKGPAQEIPRTPRVAKLRSESWLGSRRDQQRPLLRIEIDLSIQAGCAQTARGVSTPSAGGDAKIKTAIATRGSPHPYSPKRGRDETPAFPVPQKGETRRYQSILAKTRRRKRRLLTSELLPLLYPEALLLVHHRKAEISEGRGRARQYRVGGDQYVHLYRKHNKST